MVEVTITVEVVARIFGTGGLVTVLIALVVLTDTREVGVVPCDTVGARSLVGEVGPRVEAVLVVDDHILDDARTFVAKGLDHLLQLVLRAPA